MNQVLVISRSSLDQWGDSLAPVLVMHGDIVTEAGYTDKPVVRRRVTFQGQGYFAEQPQGQTGSAWAVLRRITE